MTERKGKEVSKHTPGTWSVSPDNPRKVVSDSIDGFDPLTSENLVGGASVGPFAEGNAHLIAAAPDMLAALKALVLRAEHPDQNADSMGAAIAAARAAVARAEGRS